MLGNWHKYVATKVFGGHWAPAAGPSCELLEVKAAVRGRDSRDTDFFLFLLL